MYVCMYLYIYMHVQSRERERERYQQQTTKLHELCVFVARSFRSWWVWGLRV